MDNSPEPNWSMRLGSRMSPPYWNQFTPAHAKPRDVDRVSRRENVMRPKVPRRSDKVQEA